MLDKNYVPEDFVAKIWREIGGMSVDELTIFMEKMEADQPVLMAFLLAVDEDFLSREERELVFYLGVVIWQMMARWHKQLMRVSLKKIDQAEADNVEFLEELQNRTEPGLWAVTEAMLEIYPEPEVLKYIVEALMQTDEHPGEIELSPDGMGYAFLRLKTALDALVRCVPR